MDIIEIIKRLRISAFQQMIGLSRRQAELVQYFSEFCLDDFATQAISQEQDNFGDKNTEVMELSELLGDFNPGEGNQIDSMLLYLITGREIDSCMRDWRKSSLGTVEIVAERAYDFNQTSSPLLEQKLNDETGEYGIQ